MKLVETPCGEYLLILDRSELDALSMCAVNGADNMELSAPDRDFRRACRKGRKLGMAMAVKLYGRARPSRPPAVAR